MMKTVNFKMNENLKYELDKFCDLNDLSITFLFTNYARQLISGEVKQITLNNDVISRRKKTIEWLEKTSGSMNNIAKELKLESIEDIDNWLNKVGRD